eukprot:5916532-Alexandrium_andersonii.AAC.1
MRGAHGRTRTQHHCPPVEGGDVPGQRGRGPALGGHREPMWRRFRPAAGRDRALRRYDRALRHGSSVPQDAGPAGHRHGPAPDP